MLEHVDATCADDDYCRYVTDETTVPFLTERVLPGFVMYAADTLVLDNLVAGGDLAPTFVGGFLQNDPAYDDFKGLLQQSSFTNITAGLEELADDGTGFTLFHSRYDRLVPIAGTDALASVLERDFIVDIRRDACNSEAYETIFAVTDRVGISHALCGFEVLNDVFAELR